MDQQYTLTITTTGERYVDIEILDQRFTIQQVVEWLQDGDAEGFNPIHDHPLGPDAWAGSINHDGRVVARYTISELDESGEVEGVYGNDNNEMENTEMQEVEQ